MLDSDFTKGKSQEAPYRPSSPPGETHAISHCTLWTLAGALMLLALLWPALWNGFPIVFYDTGGYLARPFEGTLAFGRSALYGAFLAPGIPLYFWPNLVAQAALVAWLVTLTLRTHGFGGRVGLTAAIVIGLCALTGLPWYAAQLMPDILVPAGVLALALLAFRANALRHWEIIVLLAVIATAMACHMSILALALGLLAALAGLRPLAARVNLPRPALILPTAAVAAGLLLAPLSNLAIAGRFAFTPGGFNFVFSRLVQDGIVARYLADRCPDPMIRLCAYRAELPGTADKWLWVEDSPFYKLGGPEQFEPDARTIVLESLAFYPVTHFKAALVTTINQFASVATGDGLTPWSWHTQWTFEHFAPRALERYLGSSQAKAPFDFTWANLVHVPVQALAISLLPAVILLGRERRTAALAALLFVALIGNAVICGVLSNPHDRYQSRLAWLAPFAITIAALGWRRSPDKGRLRECPLSGVRPDITV